MTIDLPDPLIDVVGVTAGYQGIVAIRDVDLRVSPGKIVGLLGPNGAGKTTLLKVLSGQLVPTRGHVHIGGVHINGASAADLARVGVCAIPEGRGIFPNLSVRDNLLVFSHAGVRLSDLESSTYERFPRLADRRNQLAGTLSGGEQQMLALSRGLATDPAILLIDELSMGLAPKIVGELYEIVAAVAASGVTVVVVEQFATLVLPIADTVALMNAGRIRWSGAPSDVDDVLAESYLGTANGSEPTSNGHAPVAPAKPTNRRRKAALRTQTHS
jgi:branched-chain amino acid transport system ATP-binding protein